jgi:hypothetical protein
MKPTLLLLLAPLAWASTGYAQMPPPPSSAQMWQKSQQTDSARTFTYSRYTLSGKFQVSPQEQAANRPALAVDCIPGKGSAPAGGKFLAANLLAESPLKIVYVEPEEIHGTSYYAKVVVRIRADGAKEEEEKWSAGADKASASISRDTLKRILRAHSISITTDDDHGSQLAMQFEMPDATFVEQACDLK